MIAFVRSRDERGDQRRVDVEVALADVAEDRRGTAVLDHVRGRGPRDRARDHLVAGTDADREQRQVERRGAGGDGEHVLGLEVCGHALLEQRGPRAGRQPAGAQRLDDRGDLLLPDRGRLEAELGATRRAHRPGSVRPAPHGEPAPRRRRCRPRWPGSHRPCRRRAGAARSAIRAAGRSAPTHALDRLGLLDPHRLAEHALGRDEEQDARSTRLSTPMPQPPPRREPTL